MFMKDDKKNMAALIIKKRDDGIEVEETHEEKEEDNSVAIKAAAEEIMEAMETKDADSLADALKSFLDLIGDEEEYEEVFEDLKLGE